MNGKRRGSVISSSWGTALLASIPISLFVSGLFYFWFAVANRYAVFLYEHTAAGIPRAQPFDDMTSSRYWMSGLVASSAVMVIYTALNWLLGLVGSRYHLDLRPPAWWRVWALCAVPLSVSILVITMTSNSPTLPLELAALCVAATLGGLALALPPGAWASQRPVDLLWLAADGAGLMPTLLLLRAIELPGRGISVSWPVAIVFAFGGTLAGLAWLGAMTGLRAWRGKTPPGAVALFVSGLCLSYLLMPLAHHLLMTSSSYRYISTASNFFAFNLGLQLLAIVVAACIAFGVTQVRGRRRPNEVKPEIPAD